jgi:hypothetical protein
LRVTAFVDMTDDVVEGQSMRFVLPAGGSVAVDIDGQAQGTVEGADFAHALLSIWSGRTRVSRPGCLAAVADSPKSAPRAAPKLT